MIEMEESNVLLLNKEEVESAINEAIAVIYRLQEDLGYFDVKRTAIHADEFGNYKLYKYNNYLLISSKSFWKIEDGKLTQVHPFN